MEKDAALRGIHSKFKEEVILAITSRLDLLEDPSSAAIEILALIQQKLERCDACGKLFWRVRRQSYCSPRCSQKIRHARHLARRSA